MSHLRASNSRFLRGFLVFTKIWNQGNHVKMHTKWPSSVHAARQTCIKCRLWASQGTKNTNKYWKTRFCQEGLPDCIFTWFSEVVSKTSSARLAPKEPSWLHIYVVLLRNRRKRKITREASRLHFYVVFCKTAKKHRLFTSGHFPPQIIPIEYCIFTWFSAKQLKNIDFLRPDMSRHK